MYVNLGNLPSPKPVNKITLSDFSGGLCLKKEPSAIADNQSPNMLNMLWRDGALRQRPGQALIPIDCEEAWLMDFDKAIAVYEKAIGNKLLFAYTDHLGNTVLAYAEITDDGSPVNVVRMSRDEPKAARSDSPIAGEGSFFEYGEYVYFKGIGCYKRIMVADDGTLATEDVEPYIPIIMLNANPATGVGDLYQPENRISPMKEIWYNADPGVRYAEFPCDGVCTDFALPHKGGSGHDSLLSILKVYIGAALADPEMEYSVDIASGMVSFRSAPPASVKVTVEYSVLVCEYTIPTTVDRVKGVWVKSLTTGEYVQYEIRNVTNVDDPVGRDESVLIIYEQIGDKIWNHKIKFLNPTGITSYDGKPITDPNVLNSFVKVLGLKDNSDVGRAIDDCTIACAYGSGGLESNCVVFAGASAQPNAYFWSGNDSFGGNPGYFPIMNYNLAGEFHDPIVAFGKQQNKLVVFQKNRVGSATFSIDSVNGRMLVALPYKTINDRIGCDLPGSVQLVENNLVWAHTQHGVMYLKDSTYAYETLVVCISGNINQGLFAVIESSGSRYVSSLDDGSRYWLFYGSSAYVWDYSLQCYTSNTERLSWFSMAQMMESFTSSVYLNGKWIRLGYYGLLFCLDGEISKDFDEPMSCFFRTKDFNFGTYAYKKNVDRVVFAFPRTDVAAHVTYETDLASRDELINVQGTSDGIMILASPVRVRAPKCRHIQSFAVSLSNVEEKPIELKSMEIFYTYSGTRPVRAGQRM